MTLIIRIANKFFNYFGWHLESNKKEVPADIPIDTQKIYDFVKPYTMTSLERINSLCDAVNYISANKIEGDFVECGVWKGGSIMTMLLALQNRNTEIRDIWLYDTFEGMSEPTDEDLDFNGQHAKTLLDNNSKENSTVWARSTLNEVKSNVYKTNYPEKNIKFIVGKVEETLTTGNLPEKIALLRLDTDWYESTKCEMEILFPRLMPGGILILDDYGYWAGAKKAVDEYIEKNNIRIFISRIDSMGRIAIKEAK